MARPRGRALPFPRPALRSPVGRSGWVLEREHHGAFVIGEGLAIARPGYDRPQRAVGVLLGHMIFQLVAEAARGSAMGRPLVEDGPDVPGKRHVGEKVLGKKSLALVQAGPREDLLAAPAPVAPAFL